jgi:5-methylcytosine-specific restriction endonuclease McrA
MHKVLKLNADFSPIGLVSWIDGLLLVLDGKADLIEEFDLIVRSPSQEFALPAVVRLKKFAKGAAKLGCSRENVIARDQYMCQYCGFRPRTSNGRPKLEFLTLDHVVPRAAAKNGKVWLPWINAWKPPTCWENLVTACQKCNLHKGCKPLERCGLSLINGPPRSPTRVDQIKILIGRVPIPDEWKSYLPEDSEWRSYWDGELED